MAYPLLHPESDVKTLVAHDDFALLAAFVDGLPNTLLVQLCRMPQGPVASSLFAVYREGGMLFDAIIGFDSFDDRLPFHVVLERFVREDAFRRAVVEPLRAAVDTHFRRSLS